MSTDPRRRLGLGLLALGALAACGRGEAASNHPPPDRSPGGTIHVVRDSLLPDRFEASGTAEPIQRAELASRLLATVREVLVHEGDEVKEGQVLARLDSRDVDARRDQSRAGRAAAEAAAGEARTHATRIRALYADSAAPRAQLDQAEAALARAEAGLHQAEAAEREAQVAGEYAVVRAPFNGIVTRRLVDPGSLAAPGQSLLVLEDPSLLRLSVSAPPGVAARVRRGARLAGTIEAEPVDAVVEGLAPAPGGGVVTVNAMIRNAGRAWFAGSAATLFIPLGDRRTVLVPAAAVVREGDLTGVRVWRGGVLELRWVRLGPGRGNQVEVLTGLTPGDSVHVPAGEF